MRYAASSRGTDGRGVPGTATTSTISGSLQPANAATMQVLPEGTRQSDVRKFYTATPLQTDDQDTGCQGDRLTINSVTYVVKEVSDQTGGRLSHFKAIIVRVQE